MFGRFKATKDVELAMYYASVLEERGALREHTR
jgi:hypothetical protein